MRVIAGDFDGDGATDLTAVGGAGWTTIPVAFSRGYGTSSFFATTVNTPPSATNQSNLFTSYSSNGGYTLSGWQSGSYQ